MKYVEISFYLKKFNVPYNFIFYNSFYTVYIYIKLCTIHAMETDPLGMTNMAFVTLFSCWMSQGEL